MENKYLLLYKNHTVKTVSEKKIYEIIEDDEKDIWNILVPIQSDSIEYILVKPKKFIPRFESITFDYFLTVHLYGDTSLFFDLDGDSHIYKRTDDEKKTCIKCYTPMEFYSTLYSISRILSFNNIFTYDGDMYDCFEITFDDMIIDFNMNDKRSIYRSSNMTDEATQADFEGEVSKLLNSINRFIGTHIIGGEKNAIKLKSPNRTIFVNNDSTWGIAKHGFGVMKKYTDIDASFKISQMKDVISEEYNLTYLQSLVTDVMGFKSTIFVYPEDIALLVNYIDEIETFTIFFSYDTPRGDWPIGTKLCADDIYEYDDLTEIYADYSTKISSISDTIALVCNIVSIYRALNIINNVLYGTLEVSVLYEIDLHPKGNHSDTFSYVINEENVDEIKDPYKDFFKRLRKFLNKGGYLR